MHARADRIRPVMARLRLLLACLLLFAIPLQGIAGASMLFCGKSGTHHAPAVSAHHHTGHDHAGHDHAMHAQQEEGDAKLLPDALHACAICASCCHGVAITQAEPAIALPPAPAAVLVTTVVLMHSRPAKVPDKPPRA
jgi:hypothetical protein